MSKDPKIAPEAFVHPSAVIEAEAHIHPFAYIGEGVRVGARSVVGPGAVLLAGTQVDEDCVVAAEAVLGSRGFGYVFDGRQHLRIPQVGRVTLGARSQVGPATCVDRAALDTTAIGSDCQLGALIQVAHNCQIGDDCHIGSGSGLAGSTKIGAGARFGKRVGTAGHSVYGEGVTADDLSGMTKTKIPAGTHWTGYPARQIKKT